MIQPKLLLLMPTICDSPDIIGNSQWHHKCAHTHTVSEYTLSNSMHHNSRYPWWNDRLVSFCLFSLLCTVSAKPNCAHSDKSWEWNVLRGMRKNNHISLICVRMMMVVCNWCDYNGSSSNVPLFVFCVRQKKRIAIRVVCHFKIVPNWVSLISDSFAPSANKKRIDLFPVAFCSNALGITNPFELYSFEWARSVSLILISQNDEFCREQKPTFLLE